MQKEPEIKLFGRKISLPEHGAAGGDRSSESSGGCDRCSDENREDEREEKQEQIDEELAGEGEVCDTPSSEEDDDHKNNTPSSESDKNSAAEDDVESGKQQKSELKKPDKILACPRCSSMDTKFCYYNNYNVNQPRHFCKSCQRYWTAGGTMRNVPVGAGRRKNKSSAPHCRHITISAPTATVLSFAPDANPRTPPPPPPPPPADGGQRPNPNGFPCIPAAPWQFPWSSAVPLPAVFPPGYPVPYYLWNSGGWNVPWMSPAASEAAGATSPTSTLGKHSRIPATEEGGDGRRSKKSSIVVPKTLRIDDPEEAARSSIWSTLGINYDSVSREGLFKALQPKGAAKKQSTAAAAAAASSLMQANPAALSRSLKFQEAV